MRGLLPIVFCMTAWAAPAFAGQSAPLTPEAEEARTQFVAALAAGDRTEAIRLANQVLSFNGGAALLDELSYRLVTAGASREAVLLLLSAYPYAGYGLPVRDALVQRLLNVLQDGGSASSKPLPGDLEPLRRPLDEPQLRSRQAAFWAARGDCAAVAAILGTPAPDHGYDDLLRLADCTRESSPAVASAAYARAHALQPGGPASRGLAYHAHVRGDYHTAVETWRAIGLDRLSHDDLRAAATSAIAAADAGQAGIWIEALQRQGGTRSGDSGAALLLMDLGYLHLREHRTRAARTAFEAAWSVARPTAAAEELVFITQRLDDNAAARAYARHVIDAGARSLSESRTAIDPADRLFGLRRLHEDLGRRVTVSLDGWSGTRHSATVTAARPGHVFSSYSQLEIDVRLGRQPIRSGRTVSVFTRLIADGGSPGGPWPTDNATLAAGLRWKPLRSRVLYLAAEGQTGLENRDYHDVLLRASASLFGSGARSDDWHPSGTGWFAQNLYLDAAHYVSAARTGLTADYRMSYHGKVTSNQTMEPYVRVQVNGLHAGGFERDVRGGLGVRWNLWYGASRYDAPAHKLSLGVEYQEAFETYLAETRGVFFTLGTRW